jgi:multidrug efflux pump subunit AcrA (membrane-fusion protein)
MSKEQIEEMVKIGKPQENLYLPTASDTAWIYISVYETDIALVKEGLPIEATLVAFPGEVFEGKISSITPILNSATRSLQARTQVNDSGHKLKPEMYARVQIKINKNDILSVPESAVIYTGKRNIVFVTDGQGIFTPKLVTLGAQWLYDKESASASNEDKALPFHRGMGRYHEVLKGLTTDDVVVTSGNFLVDAESQIQGAMQMFLKDLPDEASDKAKPPFDENAPFICPMKCESSDKSGKCSKCGMELVPNPNRDPVKDKPEQKEPVKPPEHKH